MAKASDGGDRQAAEIDMITSMLATFGLLAVSQAAVALAEDRTITTGDGGAVGISRDAETDLRRVWIAVHDPAVPVQLVGTPGVVTLIGVSDRYSARTRLGPQRRIAIEVEQPVSAVEVRFLLFNIWGDFVRSLTAYELRDLSTGEHEFEPSDWPLVDLDEAELHYASVAYISRVRLQDGRVISTPVESVIDAARSFMPDVDSNDVD